MRRLLVLACAVVFSEAIFFSILTPLLPDLKADHDLTEGAAGVLVGSYAAGALLFAIPAGWMAARISPRRTVITGLAGIGLFSPVFGFAGSIYLLDGARFMQGGFGALMWAGSMSWIISAAPRSHRGQLLGTVISSAVLGELLGAPLGALAHAVGTGVVFTAILPPFAALILLALTIPDAAEKAGQGLGDAVGRLRGSLVPRSLLMLGVPVVAFGLLIVAAPLRIDELGGSAVLIAVAFGCGSLIEAALGPVVGRFSDRAGRVGPYFAGTVVMAAGLVSVGVFDLLPVVAAAVLVVAFGAGLAFAPASALLTEAATAVGMNQGYASGGANVAFGGGNMVGAIVGGVIAGYTGFLLPCMIMAVILTATGLVARRLTEPMLAAPGEHPVVTDVEAR